jgi:hypothetical protein
MSNDQQKEVAEEMLRISERNDREGRLWDQLTAWGFKRTQTFPPLSVRQELAGTMVFVIVHEALSDVGFTFQINRDVTHVVETSIPAFLFNESGIYYGTKILDLTQWLEFVSKVVRERIEIISDKLFKTVI